MTVRISIPQFETINCSDLLRPHFDIGILFVCAMPQEYDGQRYWSQITWNVATGMVSKQLYRDGMARFAAAVNIVTTDGHGGPCGFTATAACSVTDDPPTLLVCLNRATQMHTIFEKNGVFCLNTLSAEQQWLSESFAHFRSIPEKERFAPPQWEKFGTGSPVLRDALASFDCRISEVHEVGTHWVMFGEVQDIRVSQGASALLYASRSYRKLSL